MNKTKRQLFDENKKLKKEKKLLNEWLYDEQDKLSVETLTNACNKLNFATKFIIFISIFLLTMSFFIMGVIWSA